MAKDLFSDIFPQGALKGVLPGENTGKSNPPLRRIWQVTDLLSNIQDYLDERFALLWVEGEISNLRIPSSGHSYFTLKDHRSQIKAVLFRTQAQKLPFQMEDGRKVLCLCRLNIYAGRGDLQLIVETVESKGEGALQLAFEQLKKRLAEEGLFDHAHKKPLPLLPRKVFAVTSPTGAALQDFLRTARSRFAAAEIVICPVKVQGADAPGEMAAALEAVKQVAENGDVVLLTRGGGSLEDLWSFNSEELARAIFNCPFPVVSAVGHEIDVTISDFVADHRAATPTAAAQLLYPLRQELLERVDVLARRLGLSLRHKISLNRQSMKVAEHRLRDPRRIIIEQRLRHEELLTSLVRSAEKTAERMRRDLTESIHSLMMQEPGRRIETKRADINLLFHRIHRSGGIHIERKRARLSALSGELDANSPLSILSRGYCAAYRLSSGTVIKHASQVSKNERVIIRPETGAILCEVLSTGENMEDVLSKS